MKQVLILCLCVLAIKGMPQQTLQKRAPVFGRASPGRSPKPYGKLQLGDRGVRNKMENQAELQKREPVFLEPIPGPKPKPIGHIIEIKNDWLREMLKASEEKQKQNRALIEKNKEKLRKRQEKEKKQKERALVQNFIRLLLPERYVNIVNRGELAVTGNEIQNILDLHNKYRGEVDPPADDMEMIYWNEELALGAEAWIKGCPPGHNTAEERDEGWGIDIGQNYCFDVADWDACIKAWDDEKQFFTFDGTNDMGKVGHYTQLVRDTVSEMGCAAKQCPRKYANSEETYLANMFICHYGPGNPPSGQEGHPYEKGSPCSTCPDHCVDNLCDCSGLLCHNDGVMYTKTCTCQCKTLYSGKDCSTPNCPAKDEYYCGPEFVYPYGYGPEDCEKFANTADVCPYMCGVC